jgi:hypothetical protein
MFATSSCPAAFRGEPDKMENVLLKAKGAKWWHSDDYASPNMSKASLGEFFHVALSAGAQIGDVWPFNPSYDRSAVFVTLYMTDEMKAEIEAKTRYRFRPPTKVHLNGVPA